MLRLCLFRHPLLFQVSILLLPLLSAPCSHGQAAPGAGFELGLELGPGWQSRNDVRIPNDVDGTRFDLAGLAGAGPRPTLRLNGIWHFNDRHGVRILAAPLSYIETGQLSHQVRFAGVLFEPGEPVESRYTFNSWRVSYRYHTVARPQWDLWLGATLKIRDAQIRLRQGKRSAREDNLGLVPLFYLDSRYRFSQRWSFNGELDALAGGPGRAIDLGLSIDFAVTPHWSVGVGYRGLEGGADTESVYNFAWFNSAVLTTRLRF